MGRVVRLFALVALLLLALIAGVTVWILWFFPNGLAAHFAENAAHDYGFALGIGKLDLKPLHEVTLDDLSIDVASNKRLGVAPIFTVKRLHATWDVHDFLAKNARLISVEVTGPRVHLEQSKGGWNWERAIADLTAAPLVTGSAAQASASATPAPTTTPAPPLQQQLADQSQYLDQMLAQLPVAAHLDHVEIRELGAEVVTSAGVLAKVDHAGLDLALHLPKGGAPTATVDVLKAPGVALEAHPSADAGFTGTLAPDVHLKLALPKTVDFEANVGMADGTLRSGTLDLPVVLTAKAKGKVDVPAGNLDVTVAKLDLDHCLDATGGLAVRALGTKGIHAEWHTAIDGERLPDDLGGKLASAISATSVHPGATIHGSIDGALSSTDPDALARTFARGRFPLTLTLKSDGESADDPIEAQGMKIGRVSHHAIVEISPERVSLEARAQIASVRSAQVLGGRPISLALENELRVPASLDEVEIRKASVDARLATRSGADDKADRLVAIAGHGSIAGLKAAWNAWNGGVAAPPGAAASPEKAGLAAVTALTGIHLSGSFDFESRKFLEVAPGARIRGAVHVRASLNRASDPFGRVRADVRYDDFSARFDDTSRIATKTKKAVESKFAGQPELLHAAAAKIAERRAAALAAAAKLAKENGESAPEDALGTPDTGEKPLFLLEGLTAHLVLDRPLILGGHPRMEALQLAADEAEVFDPATRGYYDRLGSLRAESDNVRIDRVSVGPLRISDLSAEVSYDGNAVHVNRGHMQLLGGEVVGRAIVRPTAEGVHFALAGDASGIDMSPFLLDHPVADPNDTRIHLSSAASFFLSKDDPIGSLADMRARMDMTCAGSKVIDTVLAWLDPEHKDPMYNWARAVNKKVVGLTRPQLSTVADRGMYDVTISFPSLGLSKDVRRIPLAPLLKLKFTQEMIGSFVPPGEMLPLLAARGIDADGKFLIPPIAKPEE